MTPESWTGLYIFDLALLGKPLLRILYVQPITKISKSSKITISAGVNK